RLALDVREADGQVARQPVDRVPVQVDLVELRVDEVLQAFAQAEHTLRLVRHAFPAELARLSEADAPRHVQSTGPHTALVAAPVDDRREADPRTPRTDVPRADALRAIQVCPGH